ncbi:MAG: peptidyl-prolyl cis-trans isomerase [Verrucomicrobia bacterium]|nr:peptidyl-prolyl cis-trans isomerase [Verrucomicrobiota bacterium]
MLDTIRKRQRTLLTIITFVVIVAFAWFYNPASFRRGSRPDGSIGKLDGRSVTVADVQKIGRNVQLASALGYTDLLQGLVTDGRTQDQEILSFAWNLLILRAKAKELQIQPTADQIRNAEKALAAFQTDGQFDVAKYQQFVDRALKPNGMTAGDLDEVVADNLRFAAVGQLVKSPLPEGILRGLFEQLNQKLSVATIQFKRSDFISSVSDEEIKNHYEQQKQSLQAPEKRRVEYVSFALNPEQQKLPDNQKVSLKKVLAEQADNFAQSVLQNPAAFDQITHEKGLTVSKTGLFSADKPDPLFAQSPVLVREAFSLTKENPTSDVLESQGDFYVIRLVDIQPSRPLTFDEAKDQITTTLKDEKATAALKRKADQVRQQILLAMQGGKTFAQAAEQAGVKIDTPAPFSLSVPGESSALAEVWRSKNIDLNPGDTSQPLIDLKGGVIIHLISKTPIDEKQYEDFKKSQYAFQNQQYQTIAFRDWLRTEQKKSGMPPLFGGTAG